MPSPAASRGTEKLSPESEETYKSGCATQKYKPVINIENMKLSRLSLRRIDSKTGRRNPDTMGTIAIDAEPQPLGACTQRNGGRDACVGIRRSSGPAFVDNEIGACRFGVGEESAHENLQNAPHYQTVAAAESHLKMQEGRQTASSKRGPGRRGRFGSASWRSQQRGRDRGVFDPAQIRIFGHEQISSGWKIFEDEE
ncbi:MAG: hypothetical protein IPJ30_16150 [Acidobacteria bacterium]|nr:hypothetical protein [Acidobacteriota bacterium]